MSLPDAPHDEILATTIPVPVLAASPLQRIFLSRDGLRAGWSLLLFLLLFSLLVVPTIPMFRHHAEQQHAASQHAAPQHEDRRAVDTVTQDGALFLILLLSSAEKVLLEHADGEEA